MCSNANSQRCLRILQATDLHFMDVERAFAGQVAGARCPSGHTLKAENDLMERADEVCKSCNTNLDGCNMLEGDVNAACCYRCCDCDFALCQRCCEVVATWWRHLSTLCELPGGCQTQIQSQTQTLTEMCTQLTLGLLRQTIETERPDIVILTGDIVDGRGSRGIQDFEMWLQKIADLLEQLEVSWAFIPGNHECDTGAISRAELLRVVKGFQGCVIPEGAETFNYIVRLPLNEGTESVALLFFDAQETQKLNEHGIWVGKAPYAIEPAHVNEVFQELAAGPPPQCALAFVHEPLPCFQGSLLAGRPPAGVAGLQDVSDGGLVERAKDHRVAAIFCGHNHHTDCIYQHGTMLVGYGRCGSFFPPSEWELKKLLPFPRGSRLFEVDNGSRMLRTWVADETGACVDSVEAPFPDAML